MATFAQKVRARLKEVGVHSKVEEGFLPDRGLKLPLVILDGKSWATDRYSGIIEHNEFRQLNFGRSRAMIDDAILFLIQKRLGKGF